jgi:deoxycytidylate deaminase
VDARDALFCCCPWPVGAVIVDGDNRIAGIGYNGFPRGVSDDLFSWAREGEVLDTKCACAARVRNISPALRLLCRGMALSPAPTALCQRG